MFFWAWDQHKKAQAEVREEGRKQGREQGLEQARAEYAPKIQELEEANRDLHARLAELESRRGRPYRRVLRRQRTV